MSFLKSLVFACLAVLLAAPTILLASCSNTTAYKPSGLPGLIAFHSTRSKIEHVYTIRPDGGDERAISSENLTFDGPPAWSPDGSKIAFNSSRSEYWEIWTMDADGGNRVKLTDMKKLNSLPRWSPDGSKITFISQSSNADKDIFLDIYVVDPDGANLRQLTDTSTWASRLIETGDPDHPLTELARINGMPTWSPDGSKILFVSNRDGDGSKLAFYLMNADGSGQGKFGLFFDVEGIQPDWSPVTSKIVFTRGTAAKVDIWVMDGSSPFPGLTARQLTTDIDNNHDPVWSPDGQQIAFTSDKHGNDDIIIMNADGTKPRRVTYDKANDDFPSWR